MSEQYRNVDEPAWGGQPRVRFERVTEPDATDPDWDLPEDRAAAYRRGDWHLIGVKAKAVIWVPIGGSSFSRYELTSPGVWSVESDAPESYLAELFEQERQALVAAMKTIGAVAA